MTAEPEIREDYSAILEAHQAAEERAKQDHEASLEERLAPARSQARLDEAQAEAAIMKAQGDRRLKTGGAVMAGLMGVAAVIWSLKHVEIVHDTKIVTETKLVEVPKIITETKIVEVPKVIEHEKVRVERVEAPAAAKPAAPPSQPINLHPEPPREPAPGEKMTQQEFQQSDMFKTAEKCNGRLKSHVNGVLLFENGDRCWDAMSDGSVDTSVSSNRHVGDQVTCNRTGRVYPTGGEERACYALHNGKVENLDDFRHSNAQNIPGVDAAFQDLFN